MGNTGDVSLSPERQILHAFQTILLSPTKTEKTLCWLWGSRQTDSTVESHISKFSIRLWNYEGIRKSRIH